MHCTHLAEGPPLTSKDDPQVASSKVIHGAMGVHSEKEHVAFEQVGSDRLPFQVVRKNGINITGESGSQEPTSLPRKVRSVGSANVPFLKRATSGGTHVDHPPARTIPNYSVIPVYAPARILPRFERSPDVAKMTQTGSPMHVVIPRSNEFRSVSHRSPTSSLVCGVQDLGEQRSGIGRQSPVQMN